jgi:hypothetical protein
MVCMDGSSEPSRTLRSLVHATSMRLARYPRLSRIVVLLALFQMFAPSVAAIADAARLDQREVYAHVESESSSSCVVVHDDNCLLCAIATAPAGASSPTAHAAPARAAVTPVPTACFRPPWRSLSRAAAPRAPPAVEG